MRQYFDILQSNASTGADALAITLLANTLTQLGDGAFSTVFTDTASDTVLKVCSKDDDGWLTFGLHCMDNPSKHLPDVQAIHIYEDGSYIAVIKRYVDFTPQEEYEEDSPGFMGAALYPALNITAAFYNFTLSELNVSSQAEFTSALMADVVNNSLQLDGWTDVNLADVESMIEALYILWDMYSEDFVFDCHQGNFMLDNDTVIISDPLSFII